MISLFAFPLIELDRIVCICLSLLFLCVIGFIVICAVMFACVSCLENSGCLTSCQKAF